MAESVARAARSALSIGACMISPSEHVDDRIYEYFRKESDDHEKNPDYWREEESDKKSRDRMRDLCFDIHGLTVRRDG
jgi:hypothetical protein